MAIQLTDIWVAAGIILGFQITWFSWRISREIQMGRRGKPTWLPIADWINLTSMLITIVGVFLLPIFGLKDIRVVERIFAYGIFLIFGHAMAIAGHYQLFTRGLKKDQPYFPKQEIIVTCILGICTIIYIILSFRIY